MHFLSPPALQLVSFCAPGTTNLSSPFSACAAGVVPGIGFDGRPAHMHGLRVCLHAPGRARWCLSFPDEDNDMASLRGTNCATWRLPTPAVDHPQPQGRVKQGKLGMAVFRRLGLAVFHVAWCTVIQNCSDSAGVARYGTLIDLHIENTSYCPSSVRSAVPARLTPAPVRAG